MLAMTAFLRAPLRKENPMLLPLNGRKIAYDLIGAENAPTVWSALNASVLAIVFDTFA